MAGRIRVGVTQRQDYLEDRRERRDSLDAAWAELLWGAGFLPLPILNDVDDHDDYLQSLELDALLLTGGGDVGQPPSRGRLETAALSHAGARGLPVLGVCRGMQVIVRECGGTLSTVSAHVGTRHLIDGPLSGMREVNSFHLLGVNPLGLPSQLEAVAFCSDGTIEAIRHRKMPWTAIMWHPERERPFLEVDIALIASALEGRGRL